LAHGGDARGNVLHHVKREGELSGRGNSLGVCPEGKCPDPARHAPQAFSVRQNVKKGENSVTQELAAEESFHSYESASDGGVPAELRCGTVRTRI